MLGKERFGDRDNAKTSRYICAHHSHRLAGNRDNQCAGELGLEADEVLGENVAPGDMIWISPWTMHRHRDHWDEPTRFVPQRFAGQSLPWTHGAFIPFGSGPRICIGASFAMAEAQILLAMLLQRYRIGLADNRPVLPIGLTTTLPSYEPRFSLSPV